MLNIIAAFFVLTAVVSCNSSSEGTVQQKMQWINSLKKGMTIEEVKKSKPYYVTIDWGSKVAGLENSFTYKTNVYDLVLVKDEIIGVHYQLKFRNGKFDKTIAEMVADDSKKKGSTTR